MPPCHTLMAYFVLSRNGKEAFDEVLSPYPYPDPDHLRLEPSHRDNTNTSCVKKSSPSEQYFFSYVYGQTIRLKCITLARLSGSEGKDTLINYNVRVEMICYLAKYILIKMANVTKSRSFLRLSSYFCCVSQCRLSTWLSRMWTRR